MEWEDNKRLLYLGTWMIVYVAILYVYAYFGARDKSVSTDELGSLESSLSKEFLKGETICYQNRLISLTSWGGISFKTGEVKTTTEYLIANYKADAREFREKILQHWRVETYHYHLDNLMEEDDHIAYVNPFSISILRSFALNLYQINFNRHKDDKILSPRTTTTMANISHCCKHDDELVSNLLEQ